MNLRLERTSDPRTVKFCDLVEGYSLVQQVRGPTRDAGGTLDVVCTRDDLPAPTVDVSDVVLSDRAPSALVVTPAASTTAYLTSTRRSWRSFDPTFFHTDLRASALGWTWRYQYQYQSQIYLARASFVIRNAIGGATSDYCATIAALLTALIHIVAVLNSIQFDDGLVQLYDDTIAALLDRQAPLRSFAVVRFSGYSLS